MKTKWVATPTAGNLIPDLTNRKNCELITLIIWSFLALSCSTNDDALNENESPDENEASIIYTDIEPDFKSSEENRSYDLDINQDKIMDFTLYWVNDRFEDWLWIESRPNEINGILSVSPWGTNPIALAEGAEIPKLYKNGEWFASGGYFMVGCETCDYYEWKNKENKFLGIRIQINGKSHYGWVQLYVESPTQWTVKDYAFNATPDNPILAGQTE